MKKNSKQNALDSYDVKRGSATWRNKMRDAYKKGGMEVPSKFKIGKK